MNTSKLIMTGIMMMTLTALSNTNNTNGNLTLVITEIQNPSCINSNNGQITVEPTGGNAPYTYDWNTFPRQNSATAINLSSGTYFIEVTDIVGNKYFESIELLAPEMIEADENSVLPNSESQVVNLEFSMNGGNTPYTYEFNGVSIDEPQIENLSIGIHTMKITDANNCSMIQYIQVFEIEGENESENSMAWIILEEGPIQESTTERVEFSPLVPVEYVPVNEGNELFANE